MDFGDPQIELIWECGQGVRFAGGGSALNDFARRHAELLLEDAMEVAGVEKSVTFRNALGGCLLAMEVEQFVSTGDESLVADVGLDAAAVAEESVDGRRGRVEGRHEILNAQLGLGEMAVDVGLHDRGCDRSESGFIVDSIEATVDEPVEEAEEARGNR